ncbi:MFS transporter [Kineosporia sp. NBRC 101731]|uniref:MFS transporter n=1 Tax=Kineosporia sp. NBRC 101731 TaxID=3032199 RepID=UPI0024A45D3A|nr:MFS transporter [Kineosporia sp. NBRC 101731]GLY31927.1 MFS transporter [Kineosporia sp. NBRC 101731]
MSSPVFQPLRHRAFRRVWFGETVSVVGDLSFETAFIWLVLETTGSPSTLAVVLLAQAVPRGLLLLLGGAVTDRLSPRTVMLASHLVRGCAVGLLAVLLAAGPAHLTYLVALGVVTGVAEAFFWPASDSLLPSLLPEPLLPRGNALTGLGEQIARLLGPVLGGVLVASAGPAWACAINAVSFFVAAATVAGAPRTATPELPRSSVFPQIAEGLRHARRSKPLRTALLLISAATLTYSGLFSVGLPALAQTYPDGPIVLGLLLSAWGLGQLVGTLAAAVTGLPQRWGLLIVGMSLLEGAAFLTIGITTSVQVAVPVLALLGAGVAYSSDVALPTIIQTRTPVDVLGRVSSVMNLPRVVLEPVSIAVLGVLLSRSLPWGFAIAALPVLAVGARLALDPDVRSLSTQK